MKLSRQGITTSVGYSFAFAALCSLAMTPGLAMADETDEPADASGLSEPKVSDQTSNAPVASEKSETVYVFANPDGTVKNVKVSTTLKNPSSASELADASDLSDIKNEESDSTYSGSGQNMVWDAAGENIYYTGKSSKQAPVSVKVTYFLDGKAVPYQNLAGASGKLKIRYDYENNATVKATIRGEEETLYVPFTFITAMIFDNANFKNAQVTNGKLIDDGDRAIVAGYAMPGLKKSLGSIVDDFDIPNYFEVTADVTDFEMKSSLTIATAGLMEDMSTDDLDMNELEDASSELNDAMGQILDGTGTLKKGLDKLADGANKADAASGKLASGAATVAKGNKELASGLDTMKEQSGSLTEGVDALAAGANELAEKLPVAKAGADNLTAGLQELRNGLDGATGGLSDDEIDALVNATDTLDKAANLLANGGTTESGEFPGLATLQASASNLASTLSDGPSKDAATQLAAGIGAAYQISGGVAGGATDLSTSVKQAAGSKGSETEPPSGLYGLSTLILKMENGVDTLIGGSEQIGDGIDKASTGSQQLADGINQLKAKVPALLDGINQAANGADKLKDGSNQLATGAEKLADGMDVLADGTKSAASGTGALKSGLETFADEGIGAITDKIDNDLLPFTDRLDAITQAGKDYNNFAGITKGTKGNVKFIIETDPIEKADE